MTDEPNNVTEITSHPTLREWRRPGLRRLKIAATADTPNKTQRGNEGSGGGKGDAQTVS